MTDAQRTTIMADWWPAAARAQGWKTSDRELRLRVLSVAVSFPPGHFNSVLEARDAILGDVELARSLESASQLNSREDVDRVKVLLFFLADRVQGAHEMDHPEEGTARRVREVIGEHLKCLALYPLEQPMGTAGAQALMAELIADMFNRAQKVNRLTLEELSDKPQFYRRKGSSQLHEGPSQLERLMMRLSQLLHQNKKPNGPQGYRVKAGHSLHDMRLAAGLECSCARCCRRRARAGLVSVLPVVAEAEEVAVENQPF